MGADLIVFLSPISHKHPAFTQGVEYFPPQALSPNLVMETLQVTPATAGPGTSWLNVEGPDFVPLQPLAKGFGNELKAVV